MELVTGSDGGLATPLDPVVLMLATTSADQTRLLARAMAPLCVPGDVLLLAGDLGAGKTAFVQGFGAGLGITEVITSPTFTLVRQYRVDSRRPGASDVGCSRPPVRTLLHADVYRLDHLHEIVDLGLGDLVEDGGVALVEWGDVAEPILGAGSLAVRLAVAGDHDHHRLITVSLSGGSWTGRWSALQRAVAQWRVAQ
jgi:tRNA threonylcarbamoyladenosine biosynthesis protein TsaE